MDKMKFESPDMVQGNVEKIAALFPNCVTEGPDGHGGMKRTIDFDKLRQMLSGDVLEGDEAYEFTWVGKKAAMVEANKPTRQTLRPCPEESKNWDTTENLYIEGDNLQVLKLLQESYLGKVKMIYIDPPYNTGHDFIYNDHFEMDKDEYEQQTSMYDEDGNRNFTENTDSNPRFHSDWCSMMYSRLMLARNLLTEDGVIFISIDDNEQVNLTKICDEIFGARNNIGPIIQDKRNAKNDTLNIQRNHEFILVYRNNTLLKGNNIESTIENVQKTRRDIIEENGRYYYLNDPITTRGEGGTLNARPNLGYTVYYNPQTKDKVAIADYDVEMAKTSNRYDVVYSDNQELIKQGYEPIRPPKVRGKLGCWTWDIAKFNADKDHICIIGRPGNYSVRKRTFVDAKDVKCGGNKLFFISSRRTNVRSIVDFSTNEGTIALANTINQTGIFNNPKNVEMVKYLLSLVSGDDYLILDFFSGSATTAHAVMQLNAEDGGHRKFIMVQLPEACDEKSEAYKAGYKTICDIGKERIRRAGQKIVEVNAHLLNAVRMGALQKGEPYAEFTTSETARKAQQEIAATLDTGFRVFKLDDSNMRDVYFAPDDYTQDMLSMMESNIKPDRTALDLLFGCLLEWGLPLSMPYRSETIDGCTVHTYNDGDLIACFDEQIPATVVEAIARRQPLRAVFRDSSFSSSPEKINLTEIFKLLAPDTRVKVI